MFKYYDTLAPNEGQLVIGGNSGSHQTIVANSVTVSVGDAVKTDSDGFIALATAGDAILGIVTAIMEDGAQPTLDSRSPDTLAVAADNETSAKVYVMVDVSRNSIWSVDQDGTAGTTANSDKRGAYIDIADEATLDEDTATRTRGTGGQCTTMGADQNDSTRILVKINESELESDS